MGKGVFITGTDTGVGKTVVCAALVLAFREEGVDAGYMKPVATGCVGDGGRLVSPDVAFVSEVCGVEDEYGEVNPVSFSPPVDPLSVSSEAGVAIDVDMIASSFNVLSERHEFLVVEGIGGIAVPLCRGVDVCDLIALLSLPAIVVTSPELGTINHTVLTVDYGRRRGVDMLGLVVNSAARPCREQAGFAGPAVAGRILGLPVIAEIGHDPEIARAPRNALRRIVPLFAEWAKGWN